MDPHFAFTLGRQDPACAARTGRIVTPHGVIDTPVFMAVGTQASVKAISQEDLLALDAPIILGNAYHLYLRPGTEILQQAGGLHRFMAWDRPILTDSGGFQVFSLKGLTKVSEDGVAFQSHLDGSRHFFSPESSVDMQLAIGADIIMCLDECTGFPATREDTAESMRRTLKWAKRCKDHWVKANQPQHALFGIVQGGAFEELRRESAAATIDIDFPGYAIGGVSVGETKLQMDEAVAWTAPLLPREKPRYLMGVGAPEDILRAVEAGVDMFDCVMPTRNARNGALYTTAGRINIKNKQFQNDFGPIDSACRCPVCARYSRAYLSHLFRAGEISALRLNTLHNLSFMLDLLASIRGAIAAGQFLEYKQTFLGKYFGPQ